MPLAPFRVAVFDMDGTLLNSMHIWDKLIDDYLASLGKTPGPTLRQDIRALDMRMTAAYVRAHSGVAESVDAIIDGINAHLARRMPEEVYKPYTDRLFQAYARAVCMQEIQFAAANGLGRKELNRRLRAICGDPRLKNTLQHYPWYRLPPTQAAFAMTMRFSLIGLQKLLMRLKNGG